MDNGARHAIPDKVCRDSLYPMGQVVIDLVKRELYTWYHRTNAKGGHITSPPGTSSFGFWYPVD